jgi:integrase
MALHPHGDNILGVPSTPRRATVGVRLVCRQITKYPGIGVLHIFLRGDTPTSAAREVTFYLVFANRDGGSLDITNLRERVWRPTIGRARVRARTLYQTRHTFVTLMLEAGESPGWVARQLGHTNPEMVLPPLSHVHSQPARVRRRTCAPLARY